MLVPPSMLPTFMEYLVAPFSRISANCATARQRACTGLPAPKSLQLWPPGPVKVISNRRLPRARAVMWSVLAPSSTRESAQAAGQRPLLAEIPHAAQVAFPFLAHVGH